MTADIEHFDTAVGDVSGVWPPTPETWSYSSLREAEECPRRWMLRRATYPDIWERAGYPPRPTLPVLVGNVVHGALEVILRGLDASGCTSLGDPSAVGVLREVGGYSAVIDRMIQNQVRQLEANPRVKSQFAGLRTALLMRVPEMRQRLQAIITRTTLIPRHAAPADGHPSSADRPPLSTGSYPEVDLRADTLRLVGRADLITIADDACTITDYKTGAQSDHHADQLRTYALLWDRDRELNPNVLPVERLVVAYAVHDEIIEAPTHSELDALEEQLVTRIAEAESQLLRRPPPARPSLALCQRCSVRHMCEDYWASPIASETSPMSGRAGDFVDCEAVVTTQNGSRSWVVALEPEGVQALLRTVTEEPGFALGERVRFLGALLGRDDDDKGPVSITMIQSSEMFVLGDGP